MWDAPAGAGGPSEGAGELGERFLEPVVGERLVVERRDLDPAGRAVEGERLGEDGARFDAWTKAQLRKGLRATAAGKSEKDVVKAAGVASPRLL
jgi:hypothetical protein